MERLTRDLGGIWLQGNNMNETRDISTLQEWKDNPRVVSKKNFERLKEQIKKLGQYKPLLITKEGIVIGGNMRLKAYQELGIKDVWVSVVEPKDESEMWEYALSDNDHIGMTDLDSLANMMPQLEIDWSKYAVDINNSVLISDLPKEEEEVVGEVPFSEELLEEHNYVVLYFDNAIDWTQLLSLYPLKQVQALDSKDGFRKAGVGRVIKGTDFLEKVRS